MSNNSVLHVIEQLHNAGNNRAMAAILLRLPDGLMNDYGGHLGRACAARGFAAGQTFCQLRVALLQRVRDAHGLLPAGEAAELEAWREALSRYAAGENVDGLAP